MDIEVQTVEYHRNGVTGSPFHVVRFTYESDSMIAIVFGEPKHVAVLSIDGLDDDVYPYGNRWRGDRFEDSLREAIADHQGEEAKDDGRP